MSKWLEKQRQQREARYTRIEQREVEKEEAARKMYRAATRHERKANLGKQVVEDNQLLNHLLDQWETKEYGTERTTTTPVRLQSILPTTKEQGRRLRCTRKKEAITLLGGLCASCGETNPNVLEVHHINNNGADHRLDMFRSLRGNPNIHRWVIDNPENASAQVELLCANCHTLKTYKTNSRHDRAVELLGGECSSCGMPDMRVLELNHHDGNGKQHRKEVGNTTDWVLRVGAEEARNVVSPLCSNCHALWHSTCQDMDK